MKIKIKRLSDCNGRLHFSLHMSNYFTRGFSTIFPTCDFTPSTGLLMVGCQEHSIHSPFWEQSADDVEAQFGPLWREFVECDGVEKVCSAVLRALKKEAEK
jgi:hypothetical protein